MKGRQVDGELFRDGMQSYAFRRGENVHSGTGSPASRIHAYFQLIVTTRPISRTTITRQARYIVRFIRIYTKTTVRKPRCKRNTAPLYRIGPILLYLTE
jgi:hypothetical protein